MIRRNWIFAGIGCLVGLVSGFAFASIQQTQYYDFTDRPLIEKLLPAEPVVHYQYVDETGIVRFVPTLTQVPPEWRDRAGFVEMAAVPQETPAQARMIRKLDAQRERE